MLYHQGYWLKPMNGTIVWKLALCMAAVAWMSNPADAQPAPATIGIVAAENFYGDVAQQVAGPGAAVTSILSNPDQDPHLFEASPSTARLLSAAAIVIYNGADYDPWMAKLLAASRAPNRKVIIVANLVHKKAGDNPHLWYDPATMPVYAKALAAALAERDLEHKSDYDQRLRDFLASLQSIEAKVAELHDRFAGVPVTATEPVFGYMAIALGFKMRNERFQLAVMNNTEPRVSDVAAFENDLKNHRVRLLFYNSQASDAAAQRMVRIAQQSKILVVGVTETEPANTKFQDWMVSELDAITRALSSPPS
jgi:zinc/manganese transport system substrate-binding protein